MCFLIKKRNFRPISLKNGWSCAIMKKTTFISWPVMDWSKWDLQLVQDGRRKEMQTMAQDTGLGIWGVFVCLKKKGISKFLMHCVIAVLLLKSLKNNLFLHTIELIVVISSIIGFLNFKWCLIYHSDFLDKFSRHD